MTKREDNIKDLYNSWMLNSRWKGIYRPYSAEDVIKLRGSIKIEYTLAKRGALKLWKLLNHEPVVCGLGALTGNQAIEEVQAGLKSIYCSGWQVAGDNNTAGAMYPDQSLYPVDSVPNLVKRINNALLRTDQIYWSENLSAARQDKNVVDWVVPIVADAEAGFGGNLNAYELMKAMIEAGASGVHFEDQLSSAKKCGHLGGKVLVPTQEAINKLVAARLAADVLDVPTILIARTDADSAGLITSDVDPRDRKFFTGGRTDEGFFTVKANLDQAIERGLSYAPYADLLWCETSTPDIGEAKEFADAIHEKFPGKFLAYNCSPSFNWKKKLDDKEMLTFREKLAEMGYKYQFITLAGWHALNLSMFKLSQGYMKEGMLAYSKFQQKEFAAEKDGYRAVKHQSFVGVGYYDLVQKIIMQGNASTASLDQSTEAAQF